MNILESRQERLKREAEEEREAQRREEERKDNERKMREEAQRKKEEYFLEQLKEKIKKNDIISFTIYEEELKQIALKFLLTNGYICVQNDAVGTKYTMYYVLTFAKGEFACQFK